MFLHTGVSGKCRTERPQLRLRHYLQGCGYSLPSAPDKLQLTPAQQTLTRTLIKDIGSLEAPLSQLNWLSQQAEDKRRLEVEMEERQRDSRSLEALLRNFENAESLTRSFFPARPNVISSRAAGWRRMSFKPSATRPPKEEVVAILSSSNGRTSP